MRLRNFKIISSVFEVRFLVSYHCLNNCYINLSIEMIRWKDIRNDFVKSSFYYVLTKVTRRWITCWACCKVDSPGDNFCLGMNFCWMFSFKYTEMNYSLSLMQVKKITFEIAKLWFGHSFSKHWSILLFNEKRKTAIKRPAFIWINFFTVWYELGRNTFPKCLSVNIKILICQRYSFMHLISFRIE